jgi:hypothetical protein
MAIVIETTQINAKFLGGLALNKIMLGVIEIFPNIAGAFTPRDLFRNGGQGVWFDTSDFSSMFQDAAGTIPVTAVGQPVGLIRDKSGNGNHIIQATAAARPQLQQDSSGHYLINDGVDDNLSGSLATLTPEWETDWEFWGAIRFYTGAGIGTSVLAKVPSIGAGPSSASVQGMFQRSDVVQRIVAASRVGAGASNILELNSAFVVGTRVTARCVSTTTPNELRATSNGNTAAVPPVRNGVAASNRFVLYSTAAMAQIGFYGGVATERALLVDEAINLEAYLTPAFIPRDLFSSGEQGFAYDSRDFGTMWQDAAGTVPVTAEAQLLARIDDISGNAAHRTQTVTARMPAVATDGMYELDGVDDGMESRVNTAPVSRWTHIVRIDPNDTDNSYLAMFGSDQSSAFWGVAAAGSSGTTSYASSSALLGITVDGGAVNNTRGDLHAALMGPAKTMVTVLAGLSPPAWQDIFRIGNYPSFEYRGRYGREILINRELTPQELNNAINWAGE